MAYLGNRNASGENNSFKILDDLAFTTTFNGSDANIVSVSADTITINNHRFLTGSRVTYTNGGGGNIGGLSTGTVYFTVKVDHNTIRLSTSASNAAAGNKKTWTFSAWIKRTELGKDYHCIFGSGYTNIHFMDNDRLRAVFYDGSNSYYADTFAVFRDTSAWYHIVVSCDTTHGTRIQAVRMYINGVRDTSFATASYPPQNDDLTPIGIASGTVHSVGAVGTSAYYSGYLAEVVYADGQALDQDSF